MRDMTYIIKTVDGGRCEITLQEDVKPFEIRDNWMTIKNGNTIMRFNILNIVSITTKIEEEN